MEQQIEEINNRLDAHDVSMIKLLKKMWISRTNEEIA